MAKKFSVIQKCAFGFALLFLGVYALDYVPGVMDQNGLMFGLFHMSKLIDLGHLGAVLRSVDFRKGRSLLFLAPRHLVQHRRRCLFLRSSSFVAAG